MMGLRPAISRRSCPRTQIADADDGVGAYILIRVGRKPLQRPRSPPERRAKGEFPPLSAGGRSAGWAQHGIADALL